MQSYYQNLFETAEQRGAPTPAGVTWSARLKRVLPVGLKHFVRTHILPSAHTKPWGTKRQGRLK